MLEQLYSKDGEARVYKNAQGQYFVGVTSAMKMVKELLGEEADYWGPNAKMHAFEGSGCHAAALDWLAETVGWIPSFEPPAWDKHQHPDERLFRNVTAAAQEGFAEFCKLYEVEPIGIEQEAVSVAYGLCGHIDLPCMLTWKKKRIKVICDLKFAKHVLPSHLLQIRCYARLDGMKDAQLGLIYHHDRNTGIWQVHPVDLNVGQEDVAAVTYAAKLYSWAQQKGR